MASFFSKMKNTGIKAKLQGECTLLDREAKARKAKFGIDLYDLMREQEKAPVMGGVLGSKSKANSAGAPGSFKSRIKEHWELVRGDIKAIEDKQEAMRLEKVHEEVRRERGMPAVTAKEKMANAGSAVSSRTKETKLLAQITMMDRDVRLRKEKFGVDVYEAAVEVVGKGNTGFKSGVKNAVRGGLMKVSEHEQRIQHCVEVAAREVGTIERSKQTRMREIEQLDEEGAFGNGSKERRASAQN